MTTDRELLELAAKAAGINHSGPIGETGLWIEPYDRQDAMHPLWNPFADDGDALRLAVRCSLIVEQANADDGRRIVYVFDNQVGIEQESDGNHCAATRRAIVRAAAAIGETMT